MTSAKNRLGEIIRFVVTGGVCFVIEFVALVLLRDTLLVNGLHVDSLIATRIATPAAFLISVVFNYVLCLLWVFKGAGGTDRAAKAGFLLTSVMGLLLNSLLMWLLGLLLGEDLLLMNVFGFGVTMYMVNKAISTLLVMIWNYFTKRAVLQSNIAARLTHIGRDR